MSFISVLLLSVVAGFAATVAMTLSQEVEIRLNNRPISYTPAIAVFKLLYLDFERLSARMKSVVSYGVHFVYGTVWGFPLAVLYALGITDFWPTAALFYVVVLVQGWVVVPLVGIAGLPWSWGLKAVLTEAGHKVLYALVGVFVFLLLL